MLRIAVVSNTYQEAKRFAESKFKNRIVKVTFSRGTYELDNGDVLYLCYDESNRERYLSIVFDAIVISPMYQSLLDVIRQRTEREI